LYTDSLMDLTFSTKRHNSAVEPIANYKFVWQLVHHLNDWVDVWYSDKILFDNSATTPNLQLFTVPNLTSIRKCLSNNYKHNMVSDNGRSSIYHNYMLENWLW